MISGVLAQATVTDLDRARGWYDRLFDREPDAEPMPGLLEYHLGGSFGVQVFHEPDRAGRSSIVLAESDLDAATARLREAGVADRDAEPISSGQALMLTDPDGNRVVLVSTTTTSNQQTVRRYLDGFRSGDREQILSCLTDDIRWTVFGAYRIEGKAQYAEHITEPGFSSPPALDVVRLVEQGDTVMAEMTGEVTSDAGKVVRMAMAEVFVLRDGLICERRAFVVPLTENDYR